MKIIRWLVSNIFLILFIVVVIYSYMFWGNLAGKDTPAGKAIAYLSNEFVTVEKFVDSVKAKQAQLSEHKTSKTSALETAESSYTDTPHQADETMATNPVILSNAKETFVSAEVENQLNNVDDKGEVINGSLQGDAIRDTWVMARKSFYQRKYALSEQNYQKVIDNTEDNFDAYGELGNVYFNQGKNKQAASAYFEAAAILVRKGQVNRAKSLIGLLQNLDKSKANELQKLIDETIS